MAVLSWECETTNDLIVGLIVVNKDVGLND